MAENTFCHFCPSNLLKAQMLDLSPSQSIELDVIPESTEAPGPSRELKNIAKRLKPKKRIHK